ncbi:MAG: hypothetical protein RQ723_12160, partial [Desulfuromonadales bacterium]|nr:hypothetical protein [Desulfuromonadales bacterium]
MRERFVIPLLLAAGLLLYLPGLQAGTFFMDDKVVIEVARHRASLPFGELFNYHGQNTYFRPILSASFLIDVWLWDLKPAGLHLFNILLHVANALLIYLGLRHLYPAHNGSIRPQPLLAALLFLVHPLATESVNWISGRS